MDLVNDTGIAIAMARTPLLYRDLTLATVVAKASFEVSPRGDVALVHEQLPVSEHDADTPLGTIDGDIVPVKDGCDLAVMGHAYAPSGRPIANMSVDIELGGWQRRLLVFGDRSWQRAASGYVPSAPALFTEMPLVYARAYGGRTSAGTFETAYADNPEGVGHVLRQEDVDGVPLPNVEEPDQLIRTWQDQPLPAGIAPLPRHSAIRLRRGTEVDVENGTASIKPAMFSWSHPRMNVESYPQGAPFRVCGMTPEGDWRFSSPAWFAWVEVQLGDRRAALALVADTICCFPAYRRFFVVGRRAFIYQVTPRQTRLARVRWGAMPQPTLLPTIFQLRAAVNRTVSLEPAAPDSPIPFDLMRELHPLTAIVEGLPVMSSS
jgi:hypothetical protein